jgi:GNAT superfamily N-acetyltransferase
MYRRAFGSRSERGRLYIPVGDRVRSGRVVRVAVVDDEPVGFAMMSPADEHDLSSLLGCLEPATRAILEPLGTLAADEPGTVRILAPKGVAPKLTSTDRVVNAIAVEPAWRRKGLATALGEELVAVAKASGVKHLFVHSIAGSGSQQLFEGLGFTALVELARYYPDGSGMTFLYRDLSPRP